MRVQLLLPIDTGERDLFFRWKSIRPTGTECVVFESFRYSPHPLGVFNTHFCHVVTHCGGKRQRENAIFLTRAMRPDETDRRRRTGTDWAPRRSCCVPSSSAWNSRPWVTRSDDDGRSRGRRRRQAKGRGGSDGIRGEFPLTPPLTSSRTTDSSRHGRQYSTACLPPAVRRWVPDKLFAEHVKSFSFRIFGFIQYSYAQRIFENRRTNVQINTHVFFSNYLRTVKNLSVQFDEFTR